MRYKKAFKDLKTTTTIEPVIRHYRSDGREIIIKYNALDITTVGILS